MFAAPQSQTRVSTLLDRRVLLVHDDGDALGQRLQRTQVVHEGQEPGPALVDLDVSVESVGGQIQTGEQLTDAVRAFAAARGRGWRFSDPTSSIYAETRIDGFMPRSGSGRSLCSDADAAIVAMRLGAVSRRMLSA